AGNIGTPDVYVELYDRKCDKIYRSNVVSTVYVNEPPVPLPGPDRTVECTGPTTPVTLDGSASYDPEGSPITFEWSAQGVVIDDPTSPVTVGHFPLGTYHVVLKVRDELNLATAVVEIKVVDTTPPDLHVELSRSIVWPPNHKYFDIHAEVTADDECGDLASVVLTGIYDSSSSGPSVSVQDAQFGTLDTDFRLLAEREGNGPGREYSIVYMALDKSMNLASDTVVVRVPHDRSGHARAAIGFDPGGRSLTAGAAQFALVVPSISDRGSHTGFDAMTVDVGEAQIGNSKGAVSPSSAYRGDTDGDGLEDLVLFYPTADAARLIELSDDGEEPLSFYYRIRAGDVFTVEDILELGKPVSIPLSGLEPVRGYGRAGGVKDPYVQIMPAAPAPRTSLGQAYPNPFNPSTTIPFELASGENVTLRIYDVRGQLVRTLENRSVPPGRHEIVWNGRDNSGRSVATGVYFVRLTAGSREMTRKLVLIK
ncbi:MAG: FlgD immunoglobulin-like domain containing protein, partial [bacterium]